MALQDHTVQGGLGIEITGLKNLSKTLGAVAPDLRKELYRELSIAGKEVINVARGFVPKQAPMSGWSRDPVNPSAWAAKRGRTASRGGAGWPAFDPERVSAGLVSRASKPKGSTYGGLLYLVNKDAAGAIAEVAGRKSAGKGTGSQFIQNLNDRIASPSRMIWRAYDTVGRGVVERNVLAAVKRAEDELQRRLDQPGDGA